MQVDRLGVPRRAQQGGQALALAEPVHADDVRPFRKLPQRFEQLGHFTLGIAVAEHRQREGRLGDEEVAWHELEGRIGRVGASLVVARDHRAASPPLDHDLRAAKHMAGRHEPHRHIADPKRFAERKRLRAEPRSRAKPRLHQSERLARADHVVMAGACVIRMSMRDHRAVHRTVRVDMESAWTAIEASGIDREPGLEALRMHGQTLPSSSTSDCIFFDMLATRLLQFLWFTIERCSMMKATWRAGDHLGGRVQHAYCSRRTHEAARICLLGARLLLASLAPAFAQDPRAESSPGSTRATTPQTAIWAQAS